MNRLCFGNMLPGPAEWIHTHVRAGERVGMFQSGPTGFLYPDRVVNLDGTLDTIGSAAVRAGRLSAG